MSFGGKPNGQEDFFGAACEAGPALQPLRLPGRELCSPGALPGEGESIAPVNPPRCPWQEATSLLNIWLLVPAHS